jgi:hypothetical protein
MLVDGCPVHAEREAKEKLLERDSRDQYSAQGAQVPNLLDVTRRGPSQPQQMKTVYSPRNRRRPINVFRVRLGRQRTEAMEPTSRHRIEG